MSFELDGEGLIKDPEPIETEATHFRRLLEPSTGVEQPVRVQSLQEAYDIYMKEEGHRAYSFAHFCGALSETSQHRLVFDHYTCPLCYALYFVYQEGLAENNGEPPQIVGKDDLWPLYTKHIRDLQQRGSTLAILIADYSRVFEFSLKGSLHIINFTLLLPGNQALRFDYFTYDNHSTDFFVCAMENLCHLIGSKIGKHPLCIWSEESLKSRGVVTAVSAMQRYFKTTVAHYYFNKHHGHPRCDTHSERGKQLI